jgi:hypothetical protein
MCRNGLLAFLPVDNKENETGESQSVLPVEVNTPDVLEVLKKKLDAVFCQMGAVAQRLGKHYSMCNT